MSGAIDRFRSFNRDEQGVVAVLFGLATMMMFMVVTLALDTARSHAASTKLRAALDSAALAGARLIQDESKSNAEVKTAAQMTFDTYLPNLKVYGLSTNNFDVKIDRKANTVQTLINAKVSSFFGSLTQGQANITFVRSATVSFLSKKLEVALVLDITGSMCDAPPSSGELDCNNGVKLDGAKAAAKDLTQALFAGNPIYGAVKVAMVPFSSAVNAGSYAGMVSGGASTDGCVIERTANAYSDASALSSPLSAGDAGNPNYYCPKARIEPLNPNQGAVEGSISSLKAKWGTAGHIGLAWGWYLISDQWRDVWTGDAKPRTPAPDLTKVIVLMTDGEFNTSYKNGGELHQWPDPSSTDYTVPGTSGYQALQLCSAIKAKDIKIYTVAFQAPAAAKAMLDQCATSGGSYAAADVTQLRESFKKIAGELTSMALSQ